MLQAEEKNENHTAEPAATDNTSAIPFSAFKVSGSACLTRSVRQKDTPMSRLKLARLRPENMKAKRKSEIVLSEEAKVELWALVNSWKAVRDKLHGLAEKKAEKKA